MQKDIVVGQAEQIELLNGSQARYVNLDSAASTPAFTSVLKAVNDFMPLYSSVHRGSGYKSRYSTKAYEDARSTVLWFFGADPAERVAIFGMNTSEAINKLAYRLNLGEDDVVIISKLEHHSNDLPWRSKARVVRVNSTAEGTVDMQHLEQVINEHKDNLRLVAITGASNVTGHITDIDTVARITHEAGAELMVDGAQLAPHRAIDVKALSDDTCIDYLAVSAHKMYAPFGSGALIARKDRLSSGAPEYSGGGTIDFVSLDDIVWADAPERDEVGSPNVVGAVAFAAALNQLQEIGMEQVAKHELQLLEAAISKLSEIDGITLYGDTQAKALPNRTGVVTFSVEGMNHALVAEILAAEYGIGVRSGCFCAHPYVIELLGLNDETVAELKDSKLNDEQQPIPGLVRASFGIYNTLEDIDRLAAGLQDIVNGNYSKDYTFNAKTGVYEIKNWPKL